jgi:hypothetical protein
MVYYAIKTTNNVMPNTRHARIAVDDLVEVAWGHFYIEANAKASPALKSESRERV